MVVHHLFLIGFVLGHSIGNTSKVSLWDFDRDKSEWYALEDTPSDLNVPIINWEDYKKTEDVCLLMGISFEVSHQQVGSLLNGRGIVSVSMPEVKYDSMSSLDKIEGFQQKFREILKTFNTDGVKRVHIFCAAQSSFNFAMGRQVERNHPECMALNTSITQIKLLNIPGAFYLTFKDKNLLLSKHRAVIVRADKFLYRKTG